MGPNVTTSTPWIAFISCDVNETRASQEDGEPHNSDDGGPADRAQIFSPWLEIEELYQRYYTRHSRHRVHSIRDISPTSRNRSMSLLRAMFRSLGKSHP